MKKHIGLLLLSCSLIGCGKAPVNNTSTTNGSDEPPSINSVDVVKAIPNEATIAPGTSAETLLLIKITNGYHVNANPPSLPYLKPTVLEVSAAGGVAVESVTYPDPLMRKFSFSETPLKVYEGDTNLKVKLKADQKAAPGKHNLSAKLRVQACDDKVCYAPGVVDVLLPVNIK
ncbi:MAG TPA: protein-disulfide reductase DsbD domain-containing protein [Pyrinomonadaceae bacterium]|nr:protein-disulfide reductase DsbD domain-containing protein [Pyrinomonadaceae bacterium]